MLSFSMQPTCPSALIACAAFFPPARRRVVTKSVLAATFLLTSGAMLSLRAAAQMETPDTPQVPTQSPALPVVPPALPAPPPAPKSVPRALPEMRPAPRGTRWTVPPSVASRHPDLFIPEPTYTSRDNFFLTGAADIRYRTLSNNSQSISSTDGTFIAASRFTAEYIRANPLTGSERGGVRLQALAEPERPGGTSLNRLRPSEAYAFYRFLFPGVSATIRGGQFVLPFGLIAVYDTPLQPIQSLYEKSLGLRVDSGLMLEGDYGLYHYAGSVTTGAGPNRSDPDSNKVIAFRLSRTLDSRLGLFQVGGSLLTGRLPKTGFETQLLPSGTVVSQLIATTNGAKIEQAIEYVNKTRFAGDGEYTRGNFSARGELVFGGDDDSVTQSSVWGYFVEGNYKVRPHTTLVAFARGWNFPNKPQKATTLGMGANFTLGNGLLLRALYEFERDVPPTNPTRDNPTIIRRLTLQTRLSF